MSLALGMADPARVRRLRVLLDKFNAANESLRSADGRAQLSLPRFAVIGNQSHGKSSVISRVTNIRLPSSDGICTRAPLRIASRMSTTGPNKAQLSFRAESAKSIGHLEGSGWRLEQNANGPAKGRYVKALLEDGASWPPAVESVGIAVKEATLALVGEDESNRGHPKDDIAEEEILLEWESPETPTLDVVDLPGLTNIAVENQPKELPERITRLVRDNVNKENTMMLCVLSGESADFSGFPAMEEARRADPELNNTLVVMTRIDNLNPEQQTARLKHHLSKLFATCKPLEVVVVKNTPDMDLPDQHAKEEEFLQTLKPVQDALMGQSESWAFKLGIPELVKKLQEELEARLEAEWPALRSKLKTDISRTESELKEMPAIMDAGQAAEKAHDLTHRVKETLRLIQLGKHSYLVSEGKPEVPDKFLFYKHLQELHRTQFTEVIVVPAFMDDDKVETLVSTWKKHAGEEQEEDVKPNVRHQFYRTEFANSLGTKLGALAKEAGSKVQEAYEAVIDEVFKGYDVLREEFRRAFSQKVLEPQIKKLQNYLRDTAEAQRDFHTESEIYRAAMIHYNEFIRKDDEQPVVTGTLGVEAMLLGKQQPEVKASSALANSSIAQMLKEHRTLFKNKNPEWTAHLLKCQFELLVQTVVVHNSLTDMVPRVVRSFLVNELIEERLPELIRRIDNGKFPLLGDPEWLLKSMMDSDVLQRQQALSGQLASMKTALDSLNGIDDPTADPSFGVVRLPGLQPQATIAVAGGTSAP
ncbi:hypothetical protein Agub_g3101 [Astrephomene gubernaculifera]|uniref:Dynamin-type G domain-containing protein n=1 Tax=Astrephomene gubernaculifera TaxID=47775 RepID=A0AAD3DI17_9CHLO|nr:hypothetical protein Agub_g3101 [Astrephomene gubernaculifera]